MALASLDNALPWTSISSASFEPEGDLGRMVAVTDFRYQDRIVSDQEFGWLLSDVEEYNINKEKKEIDHPRPIKEEELTFYSQLVDKKDRVKKKAFSKPLLRDQERESKKTRVAQIREDIRNHSVQVAALKDKTKTEKMVAKLTRLGYPAYYYQTLINGKIYYRIRCGPFPTIEEAKKCAKRLVDKEGLKPFIVYPTKTE